MFQYIMDFIKKHKRFILTGVIFGSFLLISFAPDSDWMLETSANLDSKSII